MFSDEVLEKFYSRRELKNVDLATQVVVLRVMEDVLTEVYGNANKFQPDQHSEKSGIHHAG